MIVLPAGPRPWTPDERIVRDDGTTARRFTIKRACNGCGCRLGDVWPEEIFAAIDGEPELDVRAECPYCGMGAIWALCRHWGDVGNDMREGR